MCLYILVLFMHLIYDSIYRDMIASQLVRNTSSEYSKVLSPASPCDPSSRSILGSQLLEMKVLLKWNFTSGGVGLDEGVHPRRKG